MNTWTNEPEDGTEERVTAYNEGILLPPAPVSWKKGTPSAGRVRFHIPIEESSLHERATTLKGFLQKRLAADYQESCVFVPVRRQDSDQLPYGYLKLGAVRVANSDPMEWERWGATQEAKRRAVYYCSFVKTNPAGQQLVNQPILPRFDADDYPSPDLRVAQLQARVRFLEAQLRTDPPYLQLYKVGGISLLVAVLSLAAWAVTGVGVPFHPVFAVMAIPVAIGVTAMAFFLRRGHSQTGGRNAVDPTTEVS